MIADALSTGPASEGIGRVWDVLATAELPAYATDERDLIVFWNAAAERWFGRPAGTAIGKPCSRVVPTHDLFGCGHASPQRGEGPARMNTVNVSLFEVPGRRRDSWTLIHVLQPIEGAGLLARLAGRLNAEPDGLHDEVPALTHREREILRCVARGFQNKEIARELHISHATVRNHIQNLLRKLDVHSKLEAVSLAFRKGWVEGSAPAAEVIPMDRGRGVVRLGVLAPPVSSWGSAPRVGG